MTKSRLLSCAGALLALFAAQPVSAEPDGPVKIGVINDQSSIYADLSGMGGVIAARYTRSSRRCSTSSGVGLGVRSS